MPEPTAYYREMNAIIARYIGSDGYVQTRIGSLILGRQSCAYSAQPIHLAQWPCFALVTQGAKRLTLGDSVFQYGVGDYLIVSLDLPVASCVTQASGEEPYFGLGMSVEGTRLQEVLARVHIPAAAAGRDETRGVSVYKAPVELLDATLRLLRLLDAPQDIAAMAPLVEQEILYRLLTGPHGPTLLRTASIDSPSNKVAKAIGWLRENYARPLRIDELAGHVGMSASSLHHHFRATASMTPMQYQKFLRLHEARRLMLVERLDAGSAGYRVGYQSPSQFSREYSRLYSLSPLRDVEHARRSGIPAVVQIRQPQGDRSVATHTAHPASRPLTIPAAS